MINKIINTLFIFFLTLIITFANEEETYSNFTKINNTTIESIFFKETNVLKQISVVFNVHDIRNVLVWKEIYIYKPKKTIKKEETEEIIKKLIECPLLEEYFDSETIQIIRMQIIYSDVSTKDIYEMPNPKERSPDGT